VQAREPDLVRADVAHDDVLVAERLAERVHDVLRRERETGRVIDASPTRARALLARPQLRRERAERYVDLSHDLDERLVMPVELGGHAVDVHDRAVAPGVPERRGPFDQVIAD